MNNSFPVKNNQEILDEIDFCIKRLGEVKKIKAFREVILKAKQAFENIDFSIFTSIDQVAALCITDIPKRDKEFGKLYDRYMKEEPDKRENFLHGGPPKKHHRKRNKRWY